MQISDNARQKTAVCTAEVDVELAVYYHAKQTSFKSGRISTNDYTIKCDFYQKAYRVLRIFFNKKDLTLFYQSLHRLLR